MVEFDEIEVGIRESIYKVIVGVFAYGGKNIVVFNVMCVVDVVYVVFVLLLLGE